MIRSVLPGEWYAVLGRDLVLALPPGSRDLAAAAWTAVDAGAEADEVLDLVLAGGLAGLAGFAMISTEGGRTRALARGQAVCLLLAGGHEVVADGRSVSTWAEASADGVTATSLEVGTSAEGAPLTVSDGLVRASRVVWPAEQTVDAAPPAAADLPAADLPAADLPDADLPAADLPDADLPAADLPDADLPAADLPAADLPAAEAPAADLPARDPETTQGDDEPFAPGPAPVLAPTPDPDPLTEPVVQQAPLPPPIWQPVDDDHDGRTMDGSWGAWDDLAAHQHGIPGQPPAPAVTARPVAALLLSTGDRIDVDRVVVLGRAPEARRFSSTDKPRLVTVPSPQQEISSTHLEVRPGTGADHGTAVVTDLGSTNGTVLAQPGLPAESLKPGIPVQLLPGAVIDLGDGLSITVTHP